jgi:hypothetical protein
MADIGRGPVGIDMVIFIYFLEEHRRFLGLLKPLFREFDEGRIELVTSALTLLEVLVVPYRKWRPPVGSQDYTSRFLRAAAQPDRLRAAAQLRGATGAQTRIRYS